MSCLVCGKDTVRLFNVYTRYGIVNHTVFDDVQEIFGQGADQYFAPYDCVCNICMNMLDNVAKLKKRIWRLITTRVVQKPVKLGKIWNLFASLKFEDCTRNDDEDEEVSEHNRLPVRSPTPNNLLAVRYNEVYDIKEEEKIARAITRQRDRSKTPYSGRRKRRRSHNWTRIKGRQRSKSVTSGISSARSTPTNRYRSRSRASVATSVPSNYRRIEYDEEDRLVGTKTRWVSREQERESKVIDWLEQSKMYCSFKDCPVYFQDHDVYNQHLIEDHQMMALYYCNECDDKYTSEFLLKKHQVYHDTSPFYCLMCADLFPSVAALQQHLDEHMSYSVSCQYCDKSFLSAKLCDEHMTKVHHDEQRKGKRRKRKLIIDAVKSSDWKLNCKKDPPDLSTIKVKCYSGFLVPGETLDVTEENLRAHNITFYTKDEWMMLEQENLIDEIDRVESEVNT